MNKVHKGVSLLYGLLGLAVAVAVLYLLAINGTYNPQYVFLTIIPMGFILLGSYLHQGEKGVDTYWNAPNQPKTSRFNARQPDMDWFGALLSVIFAYASLYLSEVFVLTNYIAERYPDDNYIAILTDVMVHFLTSNQADYLWKYWAFLTIFVVCFLLIFLVMWGKQGFQTIKYGRVTKEQKAKLVYGAALFTRNNISMDYLLLFEDGTRYTKEQARNWIARDWDITSRNDFLETMDLLKKHGIRLELDELWQQAKKQELPDWKQAICDDVITNLTEHYGYTEVELYQLRTLAAWDSDRTIYLIRLAYVAGFIDKNEMWSLMDETIAGIRGQYASWRDYYAGVLLGRTLGFDANFESSRIATMRLINNPNSVYYQFPMK